MNFLPLMMTVCPALWPPAYRATTGKPSESTSTILPLPSSPHCAPTMTAVLPFFTDRSLREFLGPRIRAHTRARGRSPSKNDWDLSGAGCVQVRIPLESRQTLVVSRFRSYHPERSERDAERTA